MASGPVRVAIIGAAVAVGAVIIGKGFPTLGFGGAAPVTHHTTTPPPTTPVTQTPTTTPATRVHPRQKGVVIGVFNATRVSGLAGVTGNKLQQNGYVLGQKGDFPASNSSFVYFRGGPQGRADATLLRDGLFKPAKVLALPSNTKNVKKTIEVVVVLGSDYAATHPLTG